MYKDDLSAKIIPKSLFKINLAKHKNLISKIFRIYFTYAHHYNFIMQCQGLAHRYMYSMR